MSADPTVEEVVSSGGLVLGNHMSSTSDGDESEAVVDSLESTNLRSLDISVVPWDIVLESRLNTHQSRGPGFSTRSWDSSIDITAVDEDLLATLDQLLVDWQHASGVV